MSAAEYTSTPVMIGVPALVQEPRDYLLRPRAGASFVAIGAAPDPELPGRGLMFIGIQAASGQLLTAILPETSLPALSELLSDAAEQMRTGRFKSPTAGGVQ